MHAERNQIRRHGNSRFGRIEAIRKPPRKKSRRNSLITVIEQIPNVEQLPQRVGIVSVFAVWAWLAFSLAELLSNALQSAQAFGGFGAL